MISRASLTSLPDCLFNTLISLMRMTDITLGKLGMAKWECPSPLKVNRFLY